MISNNNQISTYLIKNFSDLKSEKFFIHSVFNDTLNFTNYKLLFSLSKKNILSPINISVDNNLFNFIYKYSQNHKSIILNFPYLYFNSCKTNLYSFSLINTQIENIELPDENSIRKFILKSVNLTYNSRSLINIFRNSEPSDVILKKFKTLYQKLNMILQDNDLNSYENILCEIVGLGVGLTPAGDDFLYGILSTWKTFSLRNDFILLTEKFIIENQTKFNIISYNHLKSLIEGEISLKIKNIFKKLSNGEDYIPEIFILLNHGHTSGGDLLTGILTALQNK